MADPLYCPWLFGAPCLKPEVWAAWAQALLSVFAILVAYEAGSAASKRAQQMRVRAYAALIHVARGILDSCTHLPPSTILLARLKAVNSQFSATSVATAPDHRLVIPMQMIQNEITTVIDFIERYTSGEIEGDAAEAEKLLNRIARRALVALDNEEGVVLGVLNQQPGGSRLRRYLRFRRNKA